MKAGHASVREVRVARPTRPPLKAGLSRGYLARVETGRHEPTLTTLRKLAKALGVPVTALLK